MRHKLTGRRYDLIRGLALTLAACSGCAVEADSAIRSRTLFENGKETNREIRIGQTEREAVEAMGRLAEKRGSGTYRVHGQYAPLVCGLCPYWDSRYLTVDVLDGRVVAIVERGNYIVYP